MSNRKLTEGCIYALHSIADGTDVYNRQVASNLRVVESIFPDLLIITPPPKCEHVGARPFFGAILTAKGRDYISRHGIPRGGSRRGRHHEARI